MPPLTFILIIISLSCSSPARESFADYLREQQTEYKMPLSYAGKFSVTRFSDFFLLEIRSFSETDSTHRYVLSEKGDYLDKLEKKYNSNNLSFIRIPADSVVSLSSHNIAFMDALSLLGRVRGIDSAKNVANPEIHKLVAENLVYELGEGRDIDLETLHLINPDLVLLSGTGGEYDAGSLLENCNAVATYEWLEKTPLARAEWIKCTALLLGKADEGEEIFRRIESNYRLLKEKVSETAVRVTVLPNMVYGGSWAVPGGKSFAAELYRDANIVYPWSSIKSEGSLFLDFETVLEGASDADVWLVNSRNINSLDDIIKTDIRYNIFSAFRSGNVYNNNRNTGSYGNPYWEEGILYPDRILSDLVKIFHPEVENSNPFYFYWKLP